MVRKAKAVIEDEEIVDQQEEIVEESEQSEFLCGYIPRRTFQFDEADRSRFGGDWSILRTVPRDGRHPGKNMGHIRLPGTPESVTGASQQYHTFLRGTIINRSNPERDYCFTCWTDDGTDHSRKYYMTCVREKGYRPVVFDEWEMAPELQDIWEVIDGMYTLTGGVSIVLQGVRPTYDRILWCTKERFLAEEAKRNVAPPTPAEMLERNAGEIGTAITNPNVSVLPPMIEEIEHRYVPEY